MDHSRRRFLRAGGVVLGGAIAGCVGSLEESGGAPDSGTNGGEGAATEKPGIRLQSLSVGGSPGGEVRVDPPGTVTLLDFFATWCAPCKPQMAELRTIEERFGDVHLVSITSERDEDVIRSFWRDYQGTWPVALDPKLVATSKYGANSLPTMVVTDPSGAEVWRHRGLARASKIASQLEAAGASPT
jgi:thiol-disulfide isomerase/thioredoxin